MSEYVPGRGAIRPFGDSAAADAGAILGAGANIAAGTIATSAAQQQALLLAQQQQSAIDPTTILLLGVVGVGIFMFMRAKK